MNELPCRMRPCYHRLRHNTIGRDNITSLYLHYLEPFCNFMAMSCEIANIFNEALFSAISTPQSYTDTCPISGVGLTSENTIKLECGHCFNASDIYNEVMRQKKHPSKTETQTLRKHEVKCPLCRVVQPRLLPPHPHCPPVHGVNSPRRLCSFPKSCEYVFRHGKRAGEKCGRGCVGHHCDLHIHILPESEVKRCVHCMLRGPRKGQPCGARTGGGDYCKRHTKS